MDLRETIVGASDAEAHEQLRARLQARYGIEGEFLGAPTVALILGLGRTTVHDQAKANRFVIPHRLAARKPLFLLDDVVAWMLGREWPRAQAVDARPTPARRSADPAAPLFLHSDVEEAFLRVCAKRGIAPSLTAESSAKFVSGTRGPSARRTK